MCLQSKTKPVTIYYFILKHINLKNETD